MVGQRIAYATPSHERLNPDARLRVTLGLIGLFFGVIFFRLVFLMVIQHGFYTALAAGSHAVYAQLFPTRGDIFVQDSRTREEFPLAMNKDVYTVYADTRHIDGQDDAEYVAGELASIFSYDDEKKFAVYLQLLKDDDPYEPIEQNVEENVVEQLREKDLNGIGFVRRPKRFYPEGPLAAHVVGFLGKNEEGDDVGRYGVEGYWDEILAGAGGFFEGARSAGGRWIPLAGRSFRPAEDGADVLLTIDRTLQYHACKILVQDAQEYGAQSASLVIMDPSTGSIRAMCSYPEFDPNTYGQVESVNVYNNTTIFTPYEPGSIFKPVTMAAAIDVGAVTPQTVFYDSGEREAGCTKPIRNADGKIYENQTMTGVLENSINTGMVFTVEELGKELFRDYLEKFGFGVKEGIGLDTEISGTIASLSKNKGDEVDCYTATASFGQGLTATPLQMVSAFSAIANGGWLMRPRIVEEVRYSDGRTERYQPEQIRQVISARTASLVSGMLVSVVDSGHAGLAHVDGYYVGGKTGTAQIPGPGGYTEDTNHSFVGFAPIDDPKYVMLVKYEKPERRFSASTAAPTFGKISKFILQYYGVAPTR